MAAPRFDFRPYREDDEKLPAKARFAPLAERTPALGGEYFHLAVGLAIGLLTALLIYRFVRRQEGRRQERDRWTRLHALCVERGLAHSDEEALVAALREIGAAAPDEAAISSSYFHSMVAPELKRRLGAEGARRIARKLFHGGAEELPASGGTRSLTAGQKMRLHFAGMSGTFASNLITVDDNGMVVTLPAAGSRHLRPRQGERVEAYLEINNSLYTFTSEVLEVFMGGVFACRLAHSPSLQQIHRREAARVPLAKKVNFAHLPAAAVPGGQIEFNSLQQQWEGVYEGVLRDLSVGGCSIATPSRRAFEVGDLVQFTLDILADENPCDLLATIVHITPIPAREGGGRILHLQFLAISEEALGSVTRTVHRLQSEEGVKTGKA
ncbi:MAG: PilZ domain-containing protein [Planctomycetota bacterium]|nr:PilZ domain-containing protein [Planctomycetota bacterium]